MKRSTNSRSPAGELPTFLDPTSETEQVDEGLVADLVRADDELEEQAYDDEHYADEADGDAEEYDADEELGDEANDENTAARPRQPGSSRTQSASSEGLGGSFAMAAGLLVTVTAFGLACWPAGAAAIAKIGVEPQIALVIGVAMLAIGTSQRHFGRVQRRIEELDAQRQAGESEMRDAIAELLQTQGTPSTPVAEGGELQHVLLSLQRQDQKINNLTKAIKMYGKPLMEIANQGTELAGSVAQVKTMVEGGTESQRQAVNRLETQLHKGSGEVDLGELPAQIARIEVGLAAVTQRLDSSDVHKSLMRLEDVSKELHREIQQLQRGDGVRAAAAELQERLDRATQGLADGIKQLRDGNLNGLESSVREIQREVSALTTGLAQIQAAVKSGMRTAPGASAPAHAASPPPASTPLATPTAPAATAKPAASDGGYQTGKRTTNSKNVLGAIAKLKQMKG